MHHGSFNEHSTTATASQFFFSVEEYFWIRVFFPPVFSIANLHAALLHPKFGDTNPPKRLAPKLPTWGVQVQVGFQGGSVSVGRYVQVEISSFKHLKSNPPHTDCASSKDSKYSQGKHSLSFLVSILVGRECDNYLICFVFKLPNTKNGADLSINVSAKTEAIVSQTIASLYLPIDLSSS